MIKYKKGNIVLATVSGISQYGIFVNMEDDYTGLIHISEVSNKYVKDINLFVNDKEHIFVEILDIDNNSKQVKLSIKNIDYRGRGSKKKRIIETKQGFNTLEYKLPIWIEENLKNNKNKTNSLDKYV